MTRHAAINRPKGHEDQARIDEVFSSAQGEGVHIGMRQLFVRFAGCHRACRYCDTPGTAADTFRVERDPGSGRFEERANPIAAESLMTVLAEMNPAAFGHEALFLTGGEPLLQASFLAAWLPEARARLGLPVHLETSGDLPAPFARIARLIDHALMDIKLPSVTGEPPCWVEHRAFLEVIREHATAATIKLVVDADTAEGDLAEAARLLRAAQTTTPVVLQPLTAHDPGARPPSARQLLAWQCGLSRAIGRGVRIIPQCHKRMGLL